MPISVIRLSFAVLRKETRELLFFFSGTHSSSKTRILLYINFYSYFKAATTASSEDMGGKITVRKGEIPQQEKTHGDTSLAFEIQKWKLDVLSLLPPPPPPASPLSNASVFPHLFFPITICSSALLKFWHCSLSLNKAQDKNIKPIPIWKGTSSSASRSTSGNSTGALASRPKCNQCLSVVLLCHSASSDISLWQGQVRWAWRRECEKPWVHSSWCTLNWPSLQHIVTARLPCGGLPEWSVLCSSVFKNLPATIQITFKIPKHIFLCFA